MALCQISLSRYMLIADLLFRFSQFQMKEAIQRLRLFSRTDEG